MIENINGRDNQLRLYRHEKPLRIPRGADTCWLRWPGDYKVGKGEEKDWWGVTWLTQPDGGATVDETKPHLITDLADWKNQITIPDPATCGNWPDDGISGTAHWNRETQVGAIFLHMGHFERLQSLIGFENAVTAFYDEDVEDELRELFAAITEYKIECLRYIKKYFNADVVAYQDDWGMQTNMMFSPEIWHEWLKPELIKIVAECHNLGMYFEMHSCGHVQEVIKPLVDEVKIDSIQTLMYPCNDIRMVKKEVGDRLVIRGGYDGQLALKADAPEEEIRKSFRECLAVLCPGGNHIPFFYPFGENAGRGLKIFAEEIDRYEQEFGPC